MLVAEPLRVVEVDGLGSSSVPVADDEPLGEADPLPERVDVEDPDPPEVGEPVGVPVGLVDRPEPLVELLGPLEPEVESVGFPEPDVGPFGPEVGLVEPPEPEVGAVGEVGGLVPPGVDVVGVSELLPDGPLVGLALPLDPDEDGDVEPDDGLVDSEDDDGDVDEEEAAVDVDDSDVLVGADPAGVGVSGLGVASATVEPPCAEDSAADASAVRVDRSWGGQALMVCWACATSRCALA